MKTPEEYAKDMHEFDGYWDSDAMIELIKSIQQEAFKEGRSQGLAHAADIMDRCSQNLKYNLTKSQMRSCAVAFRDLSKTP